jgi:hypothetical protein
MVHEHATSFRTVNKSYALTLPSLTISRIASMLLSTAFFAIYHLISIKLKTSVVRIRHSSKTMTVSGSTYALESLSLLVRFWSPLLQIWHDPLESISHVQVLGLTRWTIGDDVADMTSVFLLEIDLCTYSQHIFLRRIEELQVFHRALDIDLGDEFHSPNSASSF